MGPPNEMIRRFDRKTGVERLEELFQKQWVVVIGLHEVLTVTLEFLSGLMHIHTRVLLDGALPDGVLDLDSLFGGHNATLANQFDKDHQGMVLLIIHSKDRRLEISVQTLQQHILEMRSGYGRTYCLHVPDIRGTLPINCVKTVQ